MEWMRRWRAHTDAPHGAPRPVEEMQTKREHRDYIKERNPPDPETRDNVGVNVLATEHARGPDVAGREMKDVHNDENQEQRSAPAHRSGRDRRNLGFSFRVSDRTCGAALARQLDRRNDVKYYGEKEHYPQSPQQLARALQK